MTDAPDNGRMLMTYRQCAEAMAVSEKTIWSLCKAGQLPVIRIGRACRISRRSLDRFITEREAAVT